VHSVYNMVESDCTLMACDLLTSWCSREMGAIVWADVRSECACDSVLPFSKNVGLCSYPVQHYYSIYCLF
jgi:hypothetical protein